MNLYAYVGNNPVNLIDPTGYFSQEEYDTINEMLEYEREHGTAATAQRFSNTWGLGEFKALQRLGWGLEPMGDKFDGKPIRSAFGMIDLDWFTDLSSFVGDGDPIGRNLTTDTYYILGKSLWNDMRMIVGSDPASMNIIYQEPAERTAISAARSGKTFRDLFPEDLMEQEKPKPENK